MEQVSTPLEAADLNQPEILIEQKTYFWHLRPTDIAAWTGKRKPELALLTGMTLTSCLISGAAMAVLFSPNLGQTLTYDPLIDDATLAASRRISLGEQLLGQVARVLEIEIIETQGPEVGRHKAAAPAMTIVAQADNAAPMPEADLAVGLKAMVVAAGVGLGVTGLMRLVPLIPFSALGPRRRQPLSQRLRSSEVNAQPFAPVVSNRPLAGQNQALIPGALTSLAAQQVGLSKGFPNNTSRANQSEPGHRPKSGAQQHRSRREALRRRLVQTSQSGRTLVGGLRPANSASRNSVAENSITAPPVHQARAGQDQRSPVPRQPASFVPLQSFSATQLTPGQGGTQPHTALWPNPRPVQPGKPAPTAPTQFDFLDDLDMRRQYPLDNRQ